MGRRWWARPFFVGDSFRDRKEVLLGRKAALGDTIRERVGARQNDSSLLKYRKKQDAPQPGG